MTEKTIMNVSGMSCGNCVKAIEQSVGQLGGVNGVHVNLEANSVEVNFDNNIVKLERIVDIIEDQGYDVLQ